MSILEKQPNTSSELEADAHHCQDDHEANLHAQLHTIHLLDGARVGATFLALLLGLAILVTTSLAFRDYNVSRFATISSDTAWLSVWPDNSAFDLKPTVALAVGAALVVFANVVALTTHHRFIRTRLAAAHMPLTFLAPFVGLVTAIVSVILFYVANQSTAVDTLPSWSCRWRFLTTTSPAPPFASLCRVGHAGVDLAILIIPVEFTAFILAGFDAKLQRTRLTKRTFARWQPTF
ncbi:hypothetical protein SEPCBS57363_006165 [Sporothrix epigloea]|uniref:Integral membrane protein n=1 Tax=Sporothrix epigloea TaxID=1892477 RepID=A0ABP0E502_9PEZI